MAHLRIGRQTLLHEPAKQALLDGSAELVDWAPIERQLDVMYSAPLDDASWPPLTLLEGCCFRFGTILSDAKFAEALDDRVSFRWFFGLAAWSRRQKALPSSVFEKNSCVTALIKVISMRSQNSCR